MITAEEFRNPPASCRIKPFWFWNGEITKEEVRCQIREMADKGLGGVFICARQGMTLPYLSKEWFDMVEYACEQAEEAGLEAWLYDEYPYPSGMSGGEVLLEHPEAEHKVLNHRRETVEGGKGIVLELGWGKVLFAKAYPLDAEGNTCWDKGIDLSASAGILQQEKIYQQSGLTSYNHKRFFSYGPQKVIKTILPEGSWRIELYTEAAMGEFKYYGGFFDPCSEAAVDTFLQTTHERYAQSVGSRFGQSILGMFSDEVGLLSPIPWSSHLPEAFQKEHGYDILKYLPALHDDMMENAFRIRYDLYHTAHELFRETYHRRVADWCREHHLLYATEVPSMRLGTQRYSDVIGGDTAHEKLGKSLEWIYDEYIPNYRSNARAVSSLARQLDRKYAMIESFHSVGWTMTLQDAKWMIDRLGGSGINLYNFHAFYYTIQDITKHDAPPSQFFQNPYWKHYRKLADYVGRMGVMVTGTESETEIAVLDPAAALWTRLGNPFQGFRFLGESKEDKEACDRIRDGWAEVCKSLLFRQLEYDHLDGELLKEARIEKGKIHLGRAVYSVVILPSCHCMEEGARKKLEEFTAQGGCLIGIGELPSVTIDGTLTDKETADAWAALFSRPGAVHLDCLDEAKLEAVCREHLQGKVSCTVTEGESRDILTSIRRDEAGRRYVFAANQGAGTAKVRIMVPGAVCRVQEHCLEDGRILGESGSLMKSSGSLEHSDSSECNNNLERLAVWTEDEDAGSSLVVEMESFESRWISLEWEAAEGLFAGDDSQALSANENAAGALMQAEKKRPVRLWIPAAGEWKVEPTGKNVLRFGEAEISLDGKHWETAEMKTFIEQCRSTGLLDSESLVFSGSFGTPQKIRPAYPLDFFCRIPFKADYVPEDLHLLMDRETAAGMTGFLVNGIMVSPES